MPLLLFCRFCVNFTGRINSPYFLRVFFFQKQQLKSHFSGYLFLRTPLDDCFCSFKLHNNRSSSLEVFYEKRFPKNFTKFSGKYRWWETPSQVSSWEFYNFFQEHLSFRTAASRATIVLLPIFLLKVFYVLLLTKDIKEFSYMFYISFNKLRLFMISFLMVLNLWQLSANT